MDTASLGSRKQPTRVCVFGSILARAARAERGTASRAGCIGVCFCPVCINLKINSICFLRLLASCSSLCLVR
jgi:hypothetical protein